MKQTLTLSLLVTVLITFTTLSGRAQDDADAKPTPKSYLSFSGGVSKGVSDFGSTDYYNNKAGFAQYGQTYSISGARYVYKNWAIQGSLSYQDVGRPGDDEILNIAAGYTADFNALTSTVTSSNRYQNVTAFLGPQYSYMHGNFTIDLGLSAGALKSFDTPNYTVAVYTRLGNTSSTTSSTFNQNTSTDFAFAYAAHLGIRYNLSDNFGLALTGKYIGSPGVKIATDYDTFSNGRLVTTQPIQIVQGTLGIFFQFH